MVVLAVIWVGATAVALIPYFNTQAVEYRIGNQTVYDCRELFDDLSGKRYTLFIFVVAFALPISVLTFVYTKICWYILRHNAPGNPDRVRDLAQWRLKIKVSLGSLTTDDCRRQN